MIDLFAQPLVHTLDEITGTTGNDSLDGTSGADSIFGLEGNDTINGAGGGDFIDGGAGMDSIHGGSGSDTIDGGADNDLIFGAETDDDGVGDSIDGGDGNDQIIVGSSGNTVDCGAGIDLLGFYGDSDILHGGDDRDQITNIIADRPGASSNAQVFGDGGDDTLIVGLSSAKGAVASTIDGGAGDDILNIFDGASGHVGSLLSGGDGDDLIKARSSGDDTIDGGTGVDIVSYVGRSYAIAFDLVAKTAAGKGIGQDSLVGVEGFVGGIAGDVATGDNKANDLAGKNGNDLLIGGGGGDDLNGGGLGDTLVGGLGADYMNGGGGHDTFVFNSVTESTNAAYDFIDHLKKHDVIDLSAIDADVNTAGDQAFVRVAAFDGHAGQMTLTISGAFATLLQVDVDGDGSADMTISLAGHVTGHTAFVL